MNKKNTEEEKIDEDKQKVGTRKEAHEKWKEKDTVKDKLKVKKIMSVRK